MSGNVTWREAVKSAIKNVVEKHRDLEFSRQTLIDEQMDHIKELTGTTGETPEQTLSRVLQELWREEEFISHVERGVYVLKRPEIVDLETVDLSLEDVREDEIDSLIRENRLVIPHRVETGDTEVLRRVRYGQQRLRALCLKNYDHECAFCEVTEEDMLIAGHIARWGDDRKNRGSLENVISMCRFHDPLFEKGYFTLTKKLEVEKHPRWREFSKPVVRILEGTDDFRLPEIEPNKTHIMMHRNRCGYGVEE